MAAPVGPTSFGYMRKDSRLVAHPDEAPIRRRVFMLFAEHQRKKIVAEILNAEGYRTRSGAQFSGQTIGRLLKERRVTGIAGSVEALIPEDLFIQCQTILTSQGADGGARRKAVHLFSGYVTCSCGEKMYVPTGSEKYVCGACRTKIPKDDLETVFRSQLKQISSSSDNQIRFKEIHESWPNLSFDTKRELIESTTDSIEIGDNKVTCFLFTL